MTEKIFPLAIVQQLLGEALDYAKRYVDMYPEAAGSEEAIARSHYTYLVVTFRRDLDEQADNVLMSEF